MEAPCISFSEEVNFKSMGEDYREIEIEILLDDVGVSEANIFYYKEDGSRFVYNNETGWSNPYWQTIDFGTTPQNVSDTFYAWLIANAAPEELRRPDDVMGYHSMNVAKVLEITKEINYVIPAELTQKSGTFFWIESPDFIHYETHVLYITCPFYIDHPDFGEVQCTKIEINTFEETITYFPSDINMNSIVAYANGEGQFDCWECVYFLNTEDVPVDREAWGFMIENGYCDGTYSSPWFMLARQLNYNIPS